MKKLILLSCIFIAYITTMAQSGNIHQFKVKDIEGNTFDFASLKGKKVLIVNTASECGLTPQYEILEEVYKAYKNNDFVIVGFPANNFGAQEPGTDKEISAFCQKNYGVSFPMMSKISVKGEDCHPIYKWLTEKENNGKENTEVKWNFQKYMLDGEGNYIGMLSPSESPDSEIIIN